MAQELASEVVYVMRWGDVVALVDESTRDQWVSLTGELPDEELVQVVAGRGGPGGIGEGNGVTGKATPILF